MKITSQGKQWLQSERGIKPGATEQEFSKALALALAEGKCSDEKFAEFTNEDDAKNGNALKSVMDQILSKLDAKKNNDGLRDDAPGMPNLDKAFAGAGADSGGGDGEPVDPHAGTNVVPAHKQYSTTKKSMFFPAKTGLGQVHPYAGQELFESTNGRKIGELSELEKAVCGAYIKMSVTNNGSKKDSVPRQFWMTEHDKDLIQYGLRHMKWGGTLHAGDDGFGEDKNTAVGLRNQMLRPDLQKAVLDDSTSGGLEAAPIAFDDLMITIPLLHSEFFPKVKLVNITRGRRIEGASIGTMTLGASTEGTAISLFNTANFIAAFDTTIFVCAGAIEIGQDFLSDSPLDIAGEISSNYQQVLMQWLDAQIIGGDGTTEPEGILNATGTVTVNSTNGAGGPWTVGDIEALLFGVTKAYKGGTDANRIGFGSLETTYRRVRGIAVSTTDQRRVFGMNPENYQAFDRFWGIGASGTGGFTSNRQAVFANFSRYRMYRRLGMTVVSEMAGATLRRANTMLLIARSRWGGHLEDGNAVAKITDGQS